MTADAMPLLTEQVVRPRGELDLATAPVFRQSLVDAINSGAARVVVDLAEVTFIDSTGLGVLVGAIKRARANGAELVAVSAAPSIRKVFEITGIEGVLRAGGRT